MLNKFSTTHLSRIRVINRFVEKLRPVDFVAPLEEGEDETPLSVETIALRDSRKAFKIEIFKCWTKLTNDFDGAYPALKGEWANEAPAKAKQPTSVGLYEQIMSLQESVTDLKKESVIIASSLCAVGAKVDEGFAELHRAILAWEPMNEEPNV